MLELDSLTARYGDREVLHDVDLELSRGEIVSVLGPSGSGKTTLLRLVAGLEKPVSGRISWDGRDLAAVPPDARGFGLMFQDHALFPHRDVEGNVAFGLRMRGDAPAMVRVRVREMLDVVGLAGSDHRSVAQLSGGEQQRVALARTLAPAPALVMLDEPLGSLDRALRERLPAELRVIFRSLGSTVIYVTHDQEEALSIADRTVVLLDGRVAADAAPEVLWARPPSASVARFLGFGNVARCRVTTGQAWTPWGAMPLSETRGQADGERWILLRPDAFVPRDDGPIRGAVAARTFRGDHWRLVVDVPGAPALEVDARWAPIPQTGAYVSFDLAPDGMPVLLEETSPSPEAGPAGSGKLLLRCADDDRDHPAPHARGR